jgi:hypothetical protein
MTIPTKSPNDLLWTLNQVHPSSTDEGSNHNYPGFVVFLGAGPSIEAGIPGAERLLMQALRDRFARNASHTAPTTPVTDVDIEDWAKKEGYYVQNNPESKYAQVMRSLFDTAASREQFVRRALRKAKVSEGYRILGELIKRGVFDTILTTNFDFLVRQGADMVLPWPLDEVCSMEQYNRFNPLPKDPRVVRLHGDFWHGNLRNTEEELIQTPEAIHRLVAELFRFYGAIVIGYAGQDSNVMQQMFPSRKWNDPDFLRNGIYWCDIKEPVDLAPNVKSFLAEGARVGRAFYVKIEGFNSLMKLIGESYGVSLSLEQDMEKDIKKYWEYNFPAALCPHDWLGSLAQKIEAAQVDRDNFVEVILRYLNDRFAPVHGRTINQNIQPSHGRLCLGYQVAASLDIVQISR